jgi:hypothetical protein
MFHVKHRADGGTLRAWDGSPFLRKDVSRETADESGPENTILQNNPMHQKITLVLQGHDIAHLRHV